MSRATHLIESDNFPFDTLSLLAERESWRKEVHRPIYHIHKWWAKRLGSVFRGALLGCALPDGAKFESEFDKKHDFSTMCVLDPFMGSGTTVGEAHKLGFTSLGRDINPIAAEAVRVALGPLDRERLLAAFGELEQSVRHRILDLYRSTDRDGAPCTVLYHFWVMQADCPACSEAVDLFASYVIAKNAYPHRKPEVQTLCPKCGEIFEGRYGDAIARCTRCTYEFDPSSGNARGATASCSHCRATFSILDAVSNRSGPPRFRLYAKLLLLENGDKQYAPATESDVVDYERCSRLLSAEVSSGRIRLPATRLDDGYNTRQAIGYGFREWRDFFNDRQLLALGWLSAAIGDLSDEPARDALLALFSGTLEFNNMFASYKGEGTGAVRHMFAHHILKPERVPIEANIWGTPKSSGSFSGLFRSRLLRALNYKEQPADLAWNGEGKVVVSRPLLGCVSGWPDRMPLHQGALYLSCGDSSLTGLPSKSVDFIVTDPPFFDNVHYSELADFFYAWQQLTPRGFIRPSSTTRSAHEVQDTDATHFERKLQGVLAECRRVLKDDGLLVFSYHHSRSEGWSAVAQAVLSSGFRVVNAHPVKAEMSVAMPKAQAKEPIQLDILLVCRTVESIGNAAVTVAEADSISSRKVERLEHAGFNLSRNDKLIIRLGQRLTTLATVEQCAHLDCENDDRNPRMTARAAIPSGDRSVVA